MGGGVFNSTPGQTTVTQGGGSPPQLTPFANQFITALAGLFTNPVGGAVTPLEQNVIRGTYGTATGAPGQTTADIAGGATIPQVDANGNPVAQSGNPFMSGLLANMNTQADLARRQLASAAQRSGALNSTDYLTQSRLLEGNLANQRDTVLANQFNTGVGQQQGAVGTGLNLANALLGMAGLPRTVATDATLQPFQMGLQALGPFFGRADTGASTAPPTPSLFSTLLSGASAAAPFLAGSGTGGTGAGTGYDTGGTTPDYVPTPGVNYVPGPSYTAPQQVSAYSPAASSPFTSMGFDPTQIAASTGGSMFGFNQLFGGA